MWAPAWPKPRRRCKSSVRALPCGPWGWDQASRVRETFMSSLSWALPLSDAWCPGAPDTVFKRWGGMQDPRLGSCCGLSQTPALQAASGTWLGSALGIQRRQTEPGVPGPALDPGGSQHPAGLARPRSWASHLRPQMSTIPRPLFGLPAGGESGTARGVGSLVCFFIWQKKAGFVSI